VDIINEVRTQKGHFNELKEEVFHSYPMTLTEYKPDRVQAFVGFFDNIKYAGNLLFHEKEIITFAFFNLVAVGLGYYLWVQILDWIPEEVWISASNSDGGSTADVILTLWSFLCVGLAAFPLGLFSACMGAAHFLHSQGKKSTIVGCFRIVLPQLLPIWLFSWIDGWWTVKQILERLPKKNDRTPSHVRIRREALYQAWKLATMGILPSFIVGHNIKEACMDSLGLLKKRLVPLLKLRFGYSTACWVIGIACYAGVFVMFPTISSYMRTEFDMYSFYFLAGVPIMVALVFIQLLFRPIYIISACHIYSDYISEKEVTISLPEKTEKTSKIFVVFAAFIILCVILAVVYFFRDELGITALLSVPYG